MIPPLHDIVELIVQIGLIIVLIISFFEAKKTRKKLRAQQFEINRLLEKLRMEEATTKHLVCRIRCMKEEADAFEASPLGQMIDGIRKERDEALAKLKQQG